MPALSPAFRRFEIRLEEVRHLLSLSAAKNKPSRTLLDNHQHRSALCRGAIVLLSSHIQGFVEDFADQVVLRMISDGVLLKRIPSKFRYHSTKADIISIQDTKSEKAFEKIELYAEKYDFLLGQAGTVSKQFESLGYKDGFGNPTCEEVKKFMKRSGFEDFEHHLKRRLKKDYLIVTNAVDQIVDRRNKIAHGDNLATLTSSEVRSYMGLARKYCSTMDSISCTYFRKLGCSL